VLIIPRRTSRETSRCRTVASVNTGAMETLQSRYSDVGGTMPLDLGGGKGDADSQRPRSWRWRRRRQREREMKKSVPAPSGKGAAPLTNHELAYEEERPAPSGKGAAPLTNHELACDLLSAQRPLSLSSSFRFPKSPSPLFDKPSPGPAAATKQPSSSRARRKEGESHVVCRLRLRQAV
jgi:hypothetical protein